MPHTQGLYRFLMTRLFASVWFLGLSVCHSAIIIDGFDTDLHDRFTNSQSFIAGAYDLSGVGITDSGRWVTMVSQNVFLSANHFAPSAGSSITFYSSNDAGGPALTRTIRGVPTRISDSDLIIGTLNEPLTGDFTAYDFASSPILNVTQFASSPYAGANAFLFGRSPTAFPNSQDMAIGRNVLDRWFNSVDAAGTTDVAVSSTVNLSGDSNFVSSEAYLQGGDSGGPLFVPSGGNQLQLVGVNWFIGSVGEGAASRNINGQSYLGNYSTEITSFIQQNAIPEVRTIGLMVTGFILWMVFNLQKRFGNLA